MLERNLRGRNLDRRGWFRETGREKMTLLPVPARESKNRIHVSQPLTNFSVHMEKVVRGHHEEGNTVRLGSSLKK